MFLFILMKKYLSCKLVFGKAHLRESNSSFLIVKKKTNTLAEKQFLCSNLQNFFLKNNKSFSLNENHPKLPQKLQETLLFLNSLQDSKNIKSDKEKISEIHNLQDQILNYLANNWEKTELQKDDIEFFFNLKKVKEKSTSNLIDKVIEKIQYPKELLKNDDFKKCIKILQIFTQFGKKNIKFCEYLSLNALNFLHQEITEKKNYGLCQELCKLLLCFTQLEYENPESIIKICKFINENMQNLSPELLTTLIYIMAINQEVSKYIDLAKWIDLFQKSGSEKIDSMNIDYLIRSLSNLMMLKDDFKLPTNKVNQISMTLLQAIEKNIDKINNLNAISMVAWTISRLEDHLLPLKSLSVKTLDQIFDLINNMSIKNCRKFGNHTFSRLLMGCQSIESILSYEIKKGVLNNIYYNLEELLKKDSLVEFVNEKEFISIFYYFAKGGIGSNEFWKILEEIFLARIEKIDLNQISYLSTGINLKKNFSENFLDRLMKKIIFLINQENKEELFKSNKFKNVIFLSTSIFTNKKLFWDIICQTIKENALLFDKFYLKKILSYMAMVRCIENDYFKFIFESNLFEINNENVLDFCLTYICLNDEKRIEKYIDEKEKCIKTIKPFLENYFLCLKAKDQNLASLFDKIKFLWVLSKLNLDLNLDLSAELKEIYVSNEKTSLISNLTNDMLIKLVWITFKIPSTEEMIVFLEKILLKKIENFQINHISSIVLYFGIDSRGSEVFWNKLLKNFNYNSEKLMKPQSLVNILSGISKNKNFTDFANPTLNKLFKKIIDTRSDFSEVDIMEIRIAVSKLSSKNKKFKIFENIF